MSQHDTACRGPAATSGSWNPNRRYDLVASGVSTTQVANLTSSVLDSYSGANNGFENGFYTTNSR